MLDTKTELIIGFRFGKYTAAEVCERAFAAGYKQATEEYHNAVITESNAVDRFGHRWLRNACEKITGRMIAKAERG